jgi:glycosyltransferase involved in cell wall biosynthesis
MKQRRAMPVSVIIPTFNHARFLADAIESVLAQSLPPSEVIVVDDGSIDHTPAILAGYQGRVQVVRQGNRGVAAARNTGATLASGELLAFLDADDAWLPGKLERQVARLYDEPELGLVHCGVEEVDADGAPLRQRLDGLEGWVAQELLLLRRSVILGGGSGVVVPRAVFREAGGFAEGLSTSADWDLYFRIARRWKVGFVPEVLLRYRLHGANMHGNVRAMERDMLNAYARSFRDADPALQQLRRRAYGNLHMVLAGSYFVASQRRDFARHALISLCLTPANSVRLLGYPLRHWRRRRIASSTTRAEITTLH